MVSIAAAGVLGLSYCVVDGRRVHWSVDYPEAVVMVRVFLSGVATSLTPLVVPILLPYVAVVAGGALTSRAGLHPRAGRRMALNGSLFFLGFAVSLIVLALAVTQGHNAGLSFAERLSNVRRVVESLGAIVALGLGWRVLGCPWGGSWICRRRGQPGAGHSCLGPSSSALLGLTVAAGWSVVAGPVLGAVFVQAIITDPSPFGVSAGLSIEMAMFVAGIAAPLALVTGLAWLALLRRAQATQGKTTTDQTIIGAMLLATGGIMASPAAWPPGTGPGLPSASQDLSSVHSQAVDEQTQGDRALETATSAKALENVGATVGEEGKGRVIYFFQPHCPNCIRLEPTIDRMMSTWKAKGVQVQKVDVSKGPNKTLARNRGVRGTPTLVFLGSGGDEVTRLIGAVSPAQIRDATALVTGD